MTAPSSPRELDELTLHRARRKDRAALGVLIETYQGSVGALLYRMFAGRTAEVEDCAQETFVRVVQAIDRFDPSGPAKPSTWILTIATRVAIDRLRKTRPTVDVDEEAPSNDPGPERSTIAKTLAARVETQMASLVPEARAALVLRTYHDLDYDEIAQIQAVEIGTVKSRIARARAALRTAITEDER